MFRTLVINNHKCAQDLQWTCCSLMRREGGGGGGGERAHLHLITATSAPLSGLFDWAGHCAIVFLIRAIRFHPCNCSSLTRSKTFDAHISEFNQKRLCKLPQSNRGSFSLISFAAARRLFRPFGSPPEEVEKHTNRVLLKAMGDCLCLNLLKSYQQKMYTVHILKNNWKLRQENKSKTKI